MTELWAAIGFPLIGTLIAVIWWQLNARIERIDTENKQQFAQFRLELADLQNKFEASAPGVLTERVKRLEMDYGLLHTWKNVMLPKEFERQSENFINAFKWRIERLERVANGALK